MNPSIGRTPDPDSDAQLQRLLDQIEDARLCTERFRRVLVLGAAVTVVGVLILVFGVCFGPWGAINHIDTGAATAAGAILSGIMIAIIAGVSTLEFFMEDRGNTSKALRRAERAYRDYLIQST